MRRLLIALLGAALLISACGDDDAGDRAAVTSVPDRTTTSSTTTTEPPVPPIDVIPRDPELITEEYVEQVLDALFDVANESLRLTVERELVDEDVIAIVEATSPANRVAEDLNELIALASEGFPGIPEDPKPIRASVVALIGREPSCVFAEVDLDTSGVAANPAPETESVRTFARLLPATEEQRLSGLNPTAWVIDDLPATTDGSEPESGC